MKLHVGVTGLSRYLKSTDRLQAGEFTDFEEVVPSSATLKKWREALAHQFRIAVAAPRALTDPEWRPAPAVKWPSGAQGFTHSPEAMDIWNTLDKAAGKLRAFTIIFRTPHQFRPTLENMDRMRAFFSAIKRKQYRLVWEASGLWSQQQILDLSSELGLIPAFDPLAPDFESYEADVKYFRIRAINKTHMMDEYGFETLMEAGYDAKRVFMIFATHSPVKHARQFLDFVYSDDEEKGDGWDND